MVLCIVEAFNFGGKPECFIENVLIFCLRAIPVISSSSLFFAEDVFAVEVSTEEQVDNKADNREEENQEQPSGETTCGFLLSRKSRVTNAPISTRMMNRMKIKASSSAMMFSRR